MFILSFLDRYILCKVAKILPYPIQSLSPLCNDSVSRSHIHIIVYIYTTHIHMEY